MVNNMYVLLGALAVGTLYYCRDLIIKKIKSFLSAQEKDETNKDREKDIPGAFYCPISQEIMRDPVMTPSGHCFEREEIERWLRKSDKCPLTGKKLTTSQLIPCINLRQAISEFYTLDK